ncbi:MAG TPA: tetratricopeptide repeat protein [Thermoanaerobaculia bacterium]|nr:tetratricopeptide repeat protein [Thermoanaerobaculia bacterium]
MLVAPGESTELAFRRQMRGQWFAWLSAQEEGDPITARAKVDEILKYSQKIEIRRITDLALAATILGRRQVEQGKPELAREAFQSATRLDPDLPEPRWARLSLAVRMRQYRSLVPDFLGACRATLADGESRRILLTRLLLVLAFAGLATAVAVLAVLCVRHGRRLVHDLAETASRLVPGGHGAELVVVVMLLAPLLLSFDVLWFGLFLFVLVFGYATWPQKVAAAGALALAVPLLPLLDRTSYELAVSSSAIVRSAEALEESRYDQRVVDSLEQARNLLPEDVDIRFLLGRVYQSLGQNERAVAEYTSAAALSPRESRSLVNRGNIRFVDGDLGSAQEDYQEALRRDPRNVPARYNLALLFAETFRTVEAGRMLAEARALDTVLVQSYQDAPTLLEVVSLPYPVEEARAKAAALERDARGRHLLGLFRGFSPGAAWRVPVLLAVPAAFLAAILLDRRRQRGEAYAAECQKCGRTFCRRCKPPGESSLLCSQCIHVYLKKDGVAIETKMQKLDDVRRRKALQERIRWSLNLVVPGTSAFLESRVLAGVAAMFLFAAGLLGVFARQSFGVVPRPGLSPALPALVFWGAVAAAGWVFGQTTARRG